MKKIRRIAYPELKTNWNVSYRPCHTGIAIDIILLRPEPPNKEHALPFVLIRASYLIPWEQIDAWSKAPRGKLITVKPKTKSK